MKRKTEEKNVWVGFKKPRWNFFTYNWSWISHWNWYYWMISNICIAMSEIKDKLNVYQKLQYMLRNGRLLHVKWPTQMVTRIHRNRIYSVILSDHHYISQVLCLNLNPWDVELQWWAEFLPPSHLLPWQPSPSPSETHQEGCRHTMNKRNTSSWWHWATCQLSGLT